MTAVLRSPSHLPSSPSSTLPYAPNDGAAHCITILRDDPSTGMEEEEEQVGTSVGRKGQRGGEEEEEAEEHQQQQQQLSLLTLLVTVVRKSLVGCSAESAKMEIGWPTNVRHVAHVTFDRFHGFLGLPVEFEPEVPRRAPSASASVFGVSAESMQCSFDSRGNSVPTILLLMQKRLYAHGGLQAEGIFRINAENSQEEHVRNQLNSGIVPDGIDVHCLAGLIKAWFRELPAGVLDCLSPEQVAQCQTEEECIRLVGLLPPMEAALLDWAINLMVDVVQEEPHNKMNARNVAMVFAPNMTQMDDPLTALMYAVQVMNFLKTLIERALKKRQEALVESASPSQSGHSDENGHQSPQVCTKACIEEDEQFFVPVELALKKSSQLRLDDSTVSPDKDISDGHGFSKDDQPCKVVGQNSGLTAGSEAAPSRPRKTGNASSRRTRIGRSRNLKKELKNADRKIQALESANKPKGGSIVSHISSSMDRVEAW